ncbi:MAG: trypsin-like serine protease, partial [Polyangiaceae bacterium]
MRQFLVVVAVASAATVTQACSGTKVEDENVRSTNGALSGGSNDTQDLFNANVVVNLKDINAPGGPTLCSGTLISPTRVLTASHCLYGPSTPPIDVGLADSQLTSGTIVHAVDPNSELGHDTDPNNTQDVAHDVGLLSVDESQLNADVQQKIANTIGHDLSQTQYAEWQSILGTHIVRPSLSAPPQGAAIFVAAWNQSPERQVRPFTGSLDLSKNPIPLFDTGNVKGDSGSPMFRVRPAPDSSRDPFAVMSGGDNQGNVNFVNLTAPDNVAWLNGNLIDHSHDGLAHVKWRSQHPLPAGETYRWMGEDDYSG